MLLMMRDTQTMLTVSQQYRLVHYNHHVGVSFPPGITELASMATGLTLQDKPSVIITDSGLGKSRHTGTVATEVGHTQHIH